MDIRIINQYRSYSARGLVKPLLCPRDSTHMHLFCRLEDDDNLTLYCLTCDWEAKLGLNTYNKIYKIVERIHLQEVS